MTTKLLKLYKNELSLKQVMIKKIKWGNYLKSLILLVFTLAVIIITKFLINSSWGDLSFLLFALWMFIFLRDATKESERIINDVNGGKSYHQIRVEGLKGFLKREGLDYNPKKLELLIKMLEQQSEELKVPFFVGRGIFLALIISIISATYTNILNKYISNIETVSIIFVVLIIGLLILMYYVSIFKFLYDEFFNGDYQRYKTIANDVRDLYFNVV
jgi:hypothetical protein